VSVSLLCRITLVAERCRLPSVVCASSTRMTGNPSAPLAFLTQHWALSNTDSSLWQRNDHGLNRLLRITKPTTINSAVERYMFSEVGRSAACALQIVQHRAFVGPIKAGASLSGTRPSHYEGLSRQASTLRPVYVNRFLASFSYIGTTYES